MRGGEKNWQHVKRGVPLRVEVGPRDIANNSTFVGRRDTGTKQGMPREELIAQVGSILDEMQNGMFARALAMQKERTTVVRSLDELKEYFQGDGSGFAIANFVDKPEIDEILKPLKVTPRCIPVDEEMSTADGDCIFTGNATQKRAVFAKSY